MGDFGRDNVPLYKIADEFSSALGNFGTVDETTGVVNYSDEEFEKIDALEMNLERKALNCAALVKRWRAQVEAIHAVIREREKAMRQIARNADRLQDYMATYLPEGSAFEDEQSRVKWRKNPPRVLVRDPKAIPVEFMRMPSDDELEKFIAGAPDKIAIRDELKAGGEIPGAELVRDKRLEIK